MKLIIAGMLHETNTFSPVPTTINSFCTRNVKGRDLDAEILAGDIAVNQMENTNTAFAAFLLAAKESGASFEVPFYGDAIPSGPIDNASFEKICDRILSSVRKGCDGVMLDLHGAMVAEDCEDPESDLVARIRSVVPEVPVCVTLDFHANIGDGLVRNVDVITGYRTFPHIDMFEAGARAAGTFLGKIRGECDPVIAWQWLPFLPHTAQCTPSREPMKSIMDQAIAAENSGKVQNASIFGGFPLSDVPRAGVSVIVVDHNRREAESFSIELARQLWCRRAGFCFEPEPLDQTIELAAALTDYPVILADHGNNAGSGGSCDTMEVLEAVLRKGLSGVIAGPFCDPAAVSQMIAAGVGSHLALEIGGKTDMSAVGHKSRPILLEGIVRSVTDGRFVVTGPMMKGVTMNLGRTAVLDTGSAKIVVSEERMEPYDLGVFTHCGIDPRRARYILIYSRQHFRAAFEPIARHILLAAGPGVCSSDMSAFRYTRIKRPLYPIDQDASWSPPVLD